MTPLPVHAECKQYMEVAFSVETMNEQHVLLVCAHGIFKV